MTPRTEPGRPRLRSSLVAAAAVGLASTLPGCGMVPRNRLSDCAKMSQSLQADNSRLRDQSIRLRTENQDLAQRAVDDAKELRRLAAENARMERSIAAYQEDREELHAAYRDVQDRVRQAVLRDESAERR